VQTLREVNRELSPYFMVQSSNGGIHAVNPKTKKTYCGRTVSFDQGWRVLDVLPSDEHQPTCKICQRYYDEPLREEMRKISRDIQNSVRDFLDTRCMIKDLDGLEHFVSTFKMFTERTVQQKKSKGKADLKTYSAILFNSELQNLEMKGFLRGSDKGKTMNVPLSTLMRGLGKQYADFHIAYINFLKEKKTRESTRELKRSIADVRNAAGCVFLKLGDE